MLNEKVAIVTGAGSGIGRATAQQLAFAISWTDGEGEPATLPARVPRRRTTKRGAAPEQLRWDALFQ